MQLHQVGEVEQLQPVFVIWITSDTDDPPGGRRGDPAAPASAGVVWVEWHQSKQTGECCVDIDGQWYSVNEAGAVPMEPPITATLDNPSDVDLRPVTPVQARDMLRGAGL